MRNLAMTLAVFGAAATMTGCAYIPGKTNLAQVADEAGLVQITTGDGTFADYKATGQHSGTEIGIGLGLGMLKLMELYPAATNEDLLLSVANDAKAGGAEAMINTQPGKTAFAIFPFIVLGVYVDVAEGTGIALN